MIIIELDYTSFSQFLDHLSSKLGAEIKNSRLELPESFGRGYIELIELPNGLEALVSSIEYHQDVLYSRKHQEDYYFVLHFNDMQLAGALNFTLQGKELSDTNQYRVGAALISSLFDMSYSVKTGTVAKTINVLLKKDWLANYLDHGDVMQILANYIMLKNTLIHPEPFDAQYRMLFDEVFEMNSAAPMQGMMIKNRIMLLLEHFLAKLYRNIVNLTPEKQGKIKTADLGKLMEIETLLVKDFGQPPPTIAMLAEKAGMSISKLKSVFKKVYGTGIYEYYQKNRMQKARSMLLTNQYTVKEVGLQLGYTNLSNFSLAFKKEFGVLPSQF